MTTEAEIRVMWPQAKNAKGCWQPPGARRAAWKGLSLSPEGDNPAHTLNQTSSLQNRDNKFVILSHQTCGTWLSRPQETKTGAKCVFLGPASSLLSKVGMR